MGGVLAVTDWVVIGVYFGICVVINVCIIFWRKQDTLEEHFLARRSMTWFFIACSLYASNMDSGHFVNLADSGASNGIAAIAYDWHAAWILLVLGLYFAPVYIRADVYTIPEYLKCRFQSQWMEIYLSLICFFNSIFIKLPIIVYVTGLFLKQTMNYNIYLSSLVLLSVTAIYTMAGGLPAVIYTDAIQCVLMIIGGVVLAIYSLKDVHGFKELWKRYPAVIGKHYNNTGSSGNSTDYFSSFPKIYDNILTSTSFRESDWTNDRLANWMSTFFSAAPSASLNPSHNSTNITSYGCYGVDKHWDHWLRPLTDNEYPWIGVLFSLPMTCIWYWCVDQINVQRILSAKNILHSRTGAIITGIFKLFPLFLMIVPGMVARVKFNDVIACPDNVSCIAKCNNQLGCSHLAYSQLVLGILPNGVKGLMFVAILAALMSTVSSIFNSTSSVFTMNIWKAIRFNPREKELLIVARVVVIVLVICGIIWIPVIEKIGYSYLLAHLRTVQSYLAPPICSVFFIGVLTPRLTALGAIIGTMLGLVLAVIRFPFDIAYPAPQCGYPDHRPVFAKLHYMYFSIIIFFASTICMCAVSSCTQPVPLQLVGSLTWQTMDTPRFIDEEGDEVKTNNIDIGMDNIKHSTEQVQRVDNDQRCNNVTFEKHSKLERWFTGISVKVLLSALLFLCIYFR